MLDRSWMRRIALAAAAGGVALALVAAPIVPGAALAKSNGSNGADHGGGKGGGKGHGKGGNSGSDAPNLVDSDSDGDSHGKGHTGHGKGHSKDAVSGVQSSHNGIHPDNHGALTSLIGRLNAAHASPTAMLNAAEHSAVGRLANYVDLLEEGEIGMATDELLAVANKDVADIGEATLVVREVNSLLGVTVGSDDETITTEEEGELIKGFDDGVVGGGLGPPPPP